MVCLLHHIAIIVCPWITHPTMVCMRRRVLPYLEDSPKSMSFTLELSSFDSKMKFSSLRSRWDTPMKWQ